jgi:lipopolysaccharide/colanic/teichoic acid biosynthesis glycosyltransferase
MAQAQAEAVYEDFPATFAVGTHAPESLWLVGQTSFAEAPADSRRYRFVKRAMDVLGALVMTILFAIPGFFIAAAILLTSRGPIFYHEMRLGRDGRPFRIWKFRSMHPNVPRRRALQIENQLAGVRVANAQASSRSTHHPDRRLSATVEP